MPLPPESPTLRALLERPALGLRLIGDASELDPGALDRPIRWVHSSDLGDPTPFLSEGLALLTTGTQFADADDYAPYTARLADRGVLGLGFGTEVVRRGVPDELAAACRAHRIPLFEVPYRTPFIAVARANAEAIAAAAYARRSWALAAQRALSMAALRSDGLGATLAELSRQLECWVGLYDGGGTLTREHPAPLDAATAAELHREVGTVLRRGARAGSALRVGETPVQLQTLGRGGHLRGVVAVATAELDQEARSVLTVVVAMVELAFAQGERLARGRVRLRAGVLEALLAGDEALARRVARAAWGALPAEPVLVAVTERGGDDVEDLLEQHSPDGGAFYARAAGGGLIVVVPASAPGLVDELARRFGLRVGVSAETGYDRVARARDQAGEALRHGDGGVTRFAAVAASGVLAGLRSDAARLRADAVLEPLRAHDAAHGTALVPTLRVWLERDARFDEAADALGVHRHTVRARVAQAARLLGADLAAFPARAEVWAALQLSA